MQVRKYSKRTSVTARTQLRPHREIEFHTAWSDSILTFSVSDVPSIPGMSAWLCPEHSGMMNDEYQMYALPVRRQTRWRESRVLRFSSGLMKM